MDLGDKLVNYQAIAGRYGMALRWGHEQEAAELKEELAKLKPYLEVDKARRKLARLEAQLAKITDCEN